MAPLFPGCDYNHWLIVMDKPGGEGAIKQQMIDCMDRGPPGILFVLPDSYMDPEYKDYREIPRKAENGGSCSSENKDIPKYNGRTRYVRPERTWADGWNICIVRRCYLGCASNCGAIKVFMGLGTYFVEANINSLWLWTHAGDER